MKILISGAGFGGLALAAALQRKGHEISLVDKSRDHIPSGFVIGLWNNGMHTLEAFGVTERIQGMSIPLFEEVIRNSTGKILAKINYRPLLEHGGRVFLLMHSDLYDVLRELIHNVPLRFQTTISALEQGPESVSVTFNDGTQDTFDLVVGADGINSRVRTLLFGQEGVSPAKLRIWFALLPTGHIVLNEPNDLFGEGTYVGVFPTPDKQIGMLFLAPAPSEHDQTAQEHIAHLRMHFGDFGWMIPELLETISASSAIGAYDIHQISLPRWYQKRVVILGDAAHAVSPTTALGGAMALEDAHVLAEELADIDATQVEQALDRYVTRRKPRIDQVRHTSDFLLWLAGMDQPAMTLVRNTVMHLMPASFLLKGMEPLVETYA